MRNSHLNLLFPQWQGGGPDLFTYKGAMELKNNYLNNKSFSEIMVNTDNNNSKKNDIFGYNKILRQLHQAYSLINQKQPQTLFTIGGSCDADITSIAYLNKKMRNKIAVLYFDAHGDIHTPESSPSKYFYGMLLRTLLGEGDEKILKLLDSKLLSSQLFMLGVRDLDKPEKEFINKYKISLKTVDEIENDLNSVIKEVKSRGFKNIYIHIDLDVLDYREFPYVSLPVSGGMGIYTFLELLKKLNKEFNNIGIGVFEYNPSGKEGLKVLKKIFKMGTKL